MPVSDGLKRSCLAAPDRLKSFRGQYSANSSNKGLAAFGIAPAAETVYLYDRIANRIIAEGPSNLVHDLVLSWEPISPGRYAPITADKVDSGVLLDWQRYKASNPYWVIE